MSTNSERLTGCRASSWNRARLPRRTQLQPGCIELVVVVVAVSRFRVVTRPLRRTQPEPDRIKLVVVVVVARSSRRTQPELDRIELVVVVVKVAMDYRPR